MAKYAREYEWDGLPLSDQLQAMHTQGEQQRIQQNIDGHVWVLARWPRPPHVFGDLRVPGAKIGWVIAPNDLALPEGTEQIEPSRHNVVTVARRIRRLE